MTILTIIDIYSDRRRPQPVGELYPDFPAPSGGEWQFKIRAAFTARGQIYASYWVIGQSDIPAFSRQFVNPHWQAYRNAYLLLPPEWWKRLEDTNIQVIETGQLVTV